MGAGPGRAVGLDIGGTKVLGLAVDPTTGVVLDERREATPDGAEALVELLGDVATALVPPGEVLAAAGVGIAGLVDTQGVLRYSPNLPGIVDLDLAGRLGDRLGVTVVVDNDATSATVAEHRHGAGVGVDDLVYVALGTGIGGGLVLDGEVRRGAHGFGGEFGHMVVDPDGPVCACGRRGCWERFASGNALGELARERAGAGVAPGILALAGGRVDAVTGEHAVAAAATGDDAALAVLEAFGDAVALGISALVASLDPSMVVVGGGVVDAGDLVMDPIRAAVARRIMGGAHRPAVPVVPAAFGGRSAAIGAASWAAAHA
jgi:glucokinase